MCKLTSTASPLTGTQLILGEETPQLCRTTNMQQPATFRNTERCLEKEPEWKAAYREQIHEMVSRGAAVKLTKEEIDSWKGPKWYVSPLVASNPHSTTTPVSLNDLLHKGPDVLNQIRGVLLRFRTGLYAALGNVKKMYNSVWLKDKEVHLHRFL